MGKSDRTKKEPNHGATRTELYAAVTFLATGLMFCLQIHG